MKTENLQCNLSDKIVYSRYTSNIITFAIVLYTYYERLAQGLKQLMCGARKFALKYISRNDIAGLTKTASEVSGIPYIMDVDKEAIERVLE